MSIRVAVHQHEQALGCLRPCMHDGGKHLILVSEEDGFSCVHACTRTHTRTPGMVLSRTMVMIRVTAAAVWKMALKISATHDFTSTSAKARQDRRTKRVSCRNLVVCEA